jgi:hypothetical protein
MSAVGSEFNLVESFPVPGTKGIPHLLSVCATLPKQEQFTDEPSHMEKDSVNGKTQLKMGGSK